VNPPTRRGALGDLPEIPWGTPDAEALARLLAPVSAEAGLDRAAATGKLRELIASAASCADPSTERALLALADRPQAVRHVFRAPLDWTDPAVWDVHRALVDAFGDDGAVSDVARLASVPLDGVDLDRPPEELWTELMNRAARQDRLEALLDTALSDAAMTDHHDVVEQVRERPWRVEATPRSGAPAPGRRRRSPGSPRSAPRSAARSVAAATLAIAAAVALVVGAGWLLIEVVSSAGLAAKATVIRGTLVLPGAAGRVVLTRGGVRVDEVPAAPSIAFPPRRLDADGDGQLDPDWRLHLERTDQPCPPRPLDLVAHAPHDWSVATATASPGPGGCRIRVAGLPDLAVGSVVSVDAGDVEPARFAVVERTDPAGAEASALGTWSGCQACWPAPATCVDAVRALLPGDPGAETQASAADVCSAELIRALRRGH
jgi:hypothetical protein